MEMTVNFFHDAQYRLWPWISQSNAFFFFKLIAIVVKEVRLNTCSKYIHSNLGKQNIHNMKN